MNYKQIIIFLAIGLLLNACLPGANNSVNISQVDPKTHVLDIDSTRRLAYVKATKSNELGEICAEPAPDTAITTSLNLLAKLEVKEAGATIKGEAKQELIRLLGRSSTLLIQREALYRLCELYTNKDLSKEQAMELYQDITHITKIIAVTEMAKEIDLSSLSNEVLLAIVKGLDDDEPKQK